VPGVLFLPDLGYNQRIWADPAAGFGPDPVADPGHTVVVAAGQAALDRDFDPISDLRAGAAYRRAALKNLLRRFYLETTDSGVQTRAVHYAVP